LTDSILYSAPYSFGEHRLSRPGAAPRFTVGGKTVLPIFNALQRAGVKPSSSHAVAGKYFLAALPQSGPVLLQALLDRSIIAQLLSAKALRIASAGLLLLWRAHVTLCKR
jgi:hypothetical protein